MVSEEFDRCHGTLLQYVEFLGSAVTPATAYARKIPSLDDLVHQYHLDPEVAFLIYRPVMRLFRCEGNSEVFWPLKDSDATASTSSANMESEPTGYSGDLILDVGSPKKPIKWSDLLETVKTMLPARAWNSLSPDLYATFWGLTLYDLYVPRSRYESEISKLYTSLKALEELSDNSSSGIAKRKKDKERIQESLDRLTTELQKHEENVASVRRRLSLEKDKWLSSCPDTLKINMEFLQRCIFPRCTFSMPDAVYCAVFVHTLHSLGTPFFNTVNHIDALICKTLQPMICCCTEYEAARLGRFLYETLKIAYHWKREESIYERECGNMPGFAVYYRFPNSQRVTYGQFIKVHWKWSQRISRLLIQCLESSEYMEIRNALILLTKISSVFPVARRSGINIEKRVTRIRNDEREDLKVLATGVAAALASRKPSWVSDEEFGMGYLDLKPPAASKSISGTAAPVQSGSVVNLSQNEPGSAKAQTTTTHYGDSGNLSRDHISRGNGRLDKMESVSHSKSDVGNKKLKGSSSTNGPDGPLSAPPVGTQDGPSRSASNQKYMEESGNRELDETTTRVSQRSSAESEPKGTAKRTTASGSVGKTVKQDPTKDDGKSGKAVGRTSASDREVSGLVVLTSAVASNGNAVPTSSKSTPSARLSDAHHNELKSDVGASKSVVKDNASETADALKLSSRLVHSPRNEASISTSRSSDKLLKRASPSEEPDRLSKRRRGDTDSKDLEGEARFSDRDKSIDTRPLDLDKMGNDDQTLHRTSDKPSERSKDKVGDRHERDYRERSDRLDKSVRDDTHSLAERQRDRSIERYRERSVERGQERVAERGHDRLSEKAKDDRNKDDRNKSRHSDSSADKTHDDRFRGQSLPPPPPLPPHVVPQSVAASRKDDDTDRRPVTTRHGQRLSPRNDEKERRRSEENSTVSADDAKRRREDDFRERKREDREVTTVKVEERDREREREKVNLSKEEMDAAAATSKRRKLKREHLPPGIEAGEYSPAAAQPPPLAMGMSQSYDGRERGDRKASMIQRTGYVEEPPARAHGKEVASKAARRDVDPMYERDWDDEKRQRAEQKRRHRK
ncbi:THO complex subunit 2 [Linum grandiflorum]